MLYVNDTGYLSVSDILSSWIDKRWFKDEHRIRGSQAHAGMSGHIKNLWVPTFPAHVMPYIETGVRWFEENVDEVYLCEERLIDEENEYTGQIDLFCKMIDGYTALIDWKTSVATAKWWAWSTAGYSNLVEKKTGKKPDYRVTVRLRSDIMKLCLVNYWEDEDDINVFLAAAKTINTLGIPGVQK